MTERTSSMAFNKIYQFLLRITLIAALGVGMASCGSSSTEPDTVFDHTTAPIVEIHLAPSSMAVGAAAGGEGSTEGGSEGSSVYEEGSGDENYIEEAQAMRIYFFDDAGKYICRLTTMQRTNDADGKGGFSLFGLVPAELVNYTNFKVVVLANWPTYDDASLVKGETTIADMTAKEWAKYQALVETNTDTKESKFIDLDRKPGCKMPFFGVQSYDNITFTQGQVTTLSESINLRRAMAKVEVIFDPQNGTTLNTLAKLDSVSICGYNPQGYCGPKSDTETFHALESGAVTTSKPVLMIRKSKASATEKEVWMAYIPEYTNIDDAGNALENKAYIKVKFAYQTLDEDYYRIEFANYGTDGKPGTPFNIERNTLYRFYVKVTERSIGVTINGWGNVFDNDYEFVE